MKQLNPYSLKEGDTVMFRGESFTIEVVDLKHELASLVRTDGSKRTTPVPIEMLEPAR